MSRHWAIFLIFLFAAVPALAVKGVPYPVEVRQPDGTTLKIRIFGDESHCWKTNLAGYLVEQDSDGWYRFSGSGARSAPLSRATTYGTGCRRGAPDLPSPLTSSWRRPETTALPSLTKGSSGYRILVIPVEFKDLPFKGENIRGRLYNLFNQVNYSENGARGSVRDWFRDNLEGYDLSFEVCDKVTLPSPASYYGANASGATDVNLRRMSLQAAELAHGAGVDFSRFDFDGDRVADNVFLIFAGHNEAEGGGDDCLWPQAWNIADSQLYLNGVKVSNFACYSEFRGPSGEEFATIGTICHELCHFLGLVDLYDINSEAEGLSSGVAGMLSIMDSGNYTDEGRTPPYLNVVERDMLSLLNPVTISSERSVELLPVWQERNIYRFRTSFSDENFYVEYRDGTKWDAPIGGRGLVIYHVDRSDNTAGSMSARLRWKHNVVNGCAAHPCCMALSSADGSGASLVADTFFPGDRGIGMIHSAINFPIQDWSGRGVGFGLDDIRETAGGLHFEVIADNSWNLPVIRSYTIEPDQRSARFQWEPSKDMGGAWQLVWGERSSLQSDTVLTTTPSYRFEGLSPGKFYRCNLTYVYMSVVGKRYDFEFHTIEKLSSFPLIAGFDKDIVAGEQLRLSILNIDEPTDSFEWYLDGRKEEGEYIRPQVGNHELKAIIRYPDGSFEVLTKTFTAKGRGDG